jgi:hypothetical protein
MQVHLERSFAAPRQRRGIVQRFLVKHEMVHRLALAPRQFSECRADALDLFLVLDPGRKIDGFVGMALVGERCMHFTRSTSVRLAQDIDCAPFDDDAQPRVEGTPWIVGRSGAVYRQQHLLHHVISAVRRDALTASDAHDE